MPKFPDPLPQPTASPTPPIQGGPAIMPGPSETMPSPTATVPSPVPESPIPVAVQAEPLPPLQNTAPVADQPVPPSDPPAPPPLPTQDLSVKQSPFRFVAPIIVVLLVVGIIAFVASKFLGSQNTPTAKSTKTPVKQESIDITYWGLWEPSPIMEQVFADFKKDNPGVTVKYVQQSPQDYRERLQTALQSGSGPDLFRYHNTWVPMLQSQLATIPSDVMPAATFDATFYPVAQTWLKTTKGYVGIPLMIDGLGLYYNQTIFDAAGKTPPTTWDELRKTAQELTVRDAKTGGIQRAGAALGTTGNIDNWPDIVGLMLLQNSANPAKPNNSYGQDALAYYTLFSQSDKPTDKVWDDTLPASTYAFATEKVAMILAPSWRAHEIRDINPNLKFAVAPAPQLPNTNVTWASFWAEGVSLGSSKAKQTAAWKLAAYLSSKEVLRRFYTAASEQRLFGEPFSRLDLADQLVGDPYAGVYVSQAPKAQSWYLSSRTFDNGINDKIIKYYEDAINSMSQATPAEKVLPTTEAGVAQILSQYGVANP